MARLQDIYRDKVAPELTKQFGYTSPMQVPLLPPTPLPPGASAAFIDKKKIKKKKKEKTKTPCSR